MNRAEFDAVYDKLSRKQRIVLKEFLAGKSEEEISKTLDVQSGSSVRHHISNICSQFGLRDESNKFFSCRQDLIELFCQYKSELVSSPALEKYKVPLDISEPQIPNRKILESRCFNKLLEPGSLVRIKGLKQTGKTRLVARVFERLKQEGYKVVKLNLEQADSKQLADLDKFLRWLCEKLNRELHLGHKLEEFWEEDVGSKMSCTYYFEDCILPKNDSPLVLCLDNIDEIFWHREVADDLFPLLRSWYDAARSEPKSPWKQLRLVLAYATEPYVSLNINQSPFNVGVLVELPALVKDEIQQFARSYGLNINLSQIEKLMEMVGGHPHLLELAFSHLKDFPNSSFDRLLASAASGDGIYGGHLLQRFADLQGKPELARTFQRIVAATDSLQIDTIQAHQLQCLGLIQSQSNNVKPRCELYRLYFRDRLGGI